MSILKIKNGDTLSMACVDDSGDLTGVTVESSIRFGRGSPVALTVTETDMSAGEYLLSATPATTASWPVGQAACDIKYTIAGCNLGDGPNPRRLCQPGTLAGPWQNGPIGPEQTPCRAGA